MHVRSKAGLGLALAVMTAGVFAASPSALADTSAQVNDAVFVGSDTVQFASTFVLDGDASADPGYNAGVTNRGVDFFSTGDANGRATVAGGTATAGGVTGTPGTAPETVILRAGTRPVIRPNGSGAGIGALVQDAPNGSGYAGLPLGSINFARASRLPSTTNSTEDAACPTTSTCGGLHAYEIAYDTLQLASLASGSNAVPLSAAQLYHIYNCDSGYRTWNQVGGSSTDPIIPVIPQSGSGTRNFFIATIDSATGNTTAPSLSSSCVRTAQEHDPTGITLASTPADAIEPFSGARLNLLNTTTSSGLSYFGNSSTTPGTAATGYAPGTLHFITGTPSDNGSTAAGSGTNFSTIRSVYLVVRQSDIAKACSATTTPACFTPGGTQNAIQVLLTNRNAAFRSASFAANIMAAGFTPHYQDCGINPDDSATSTNSCVTNPVSGTGTS